MKKTECLKLLTEDMINDREKFAVMTNDEVRKYVWKKWGVEISTPYICKVRKQTNTPVPYDLIKARAHWRLDSCQIIINLRKNVYEV